MRVSPSPEEFCRVAAVPTEEREEEEEEVGFGFGLGFEGSVEVVWHNVLLVLVLV